MTAILIMVLGVDKGDTKMNISEFMKKLDQLEIEAQALKQLKEDVETAHRFRGLLLHMEND